MARRSTQQRCAAGVSDLGLCRCAPDGSEIRRGWCRELRGFERVWDAVGSGLWDSKGSGVQQGLRLPWAAGQPTAPKNRKEIGDRRSEIGRSFPERSGERGPSPGQRFSDKAALGEAHKIVSHREKANYFCSHTAQRPRGTLTVHKQMEPTASLCASA